MGRKTLTLTDEAYNRLKSYQRKDESFSEVIIRLEKPQRDPTKARGLWDGTDMGVDHDERHQQLSNEINEHCDENMNS